MNAFDPHAEFLQHATRSGITRKVASLHSMQPKFREGMRRHRPRRLCCVPVPPLIGRDPVAKFSMTMRRCDLQADGAQESARRLP